MQYSVKCLVDRVVSLTESIRYSYDNVISKKNRTITYPVPVVLFLFEIILSKFRISEERLSR